MPTPQLHTQWAHDLALDFNPFEATGVVASVTRLNLQIEDRLGLLELGARIEVETTKGALVAEVVGVGEGSATALPFGSLEGVRRGARVFFNRACAEIRPSHAWLGRVVNAFGEPVDNKGPLAAGRVACNVKARAPLAALRARLGAPVDFGVKALNAFAPACAGQRLGVFSAAGVGKSSLLSMIARNTACDVAVIALIGERGREVREFIEDQLGPEGMARSVIVVATSDESALMRREAAFLAMTVCEYFRDFHALGDSERGAHVLCLMDSLTRVAAAQREIGLAAGEPPAARGYTPSVFSLLPQLLERAGPGVEQGDGAMRKPGAVSGVFSVLVDGDDHDEPVADACRALLDGHVVLDRRIAESGRFPAVNILTTVSRLAPSQMDPALAALTVKARKLESVYDDMREMIRIGAYQHGANAEIDEAIVFHDRLEEFLTQKRDPSYSIENTVSALEAIIGAGTP